MAYCGGVLSGQLGAAIGAGGVGLQLFAAGGVMRGSAKDIVGGEVYQRTADGLHGLGHISYGVAVDAQRCSFVALCFVYIGVGGAVHYQAYIVLCYKGGHIFTRGDVQLLDVGEQPVVRRCRCQQAHVSAQLSVGSCDQYVHALTKGVTKSLNIGCLRSLSESSTLLGSIFQSMARVGSFHAMAPSASGW